jgi:hypothetical protein
VIVYQTAGALLLLGAVAAVWNFLAGRGAAAVRRGALISAALTLALVVNCSATGLSDGAELILRAPLAYLLMLAALVGPLMAALLAPALLSERPSAAETAAWLAAAAAVVTSSVAFAVSFALVPLSRPTPGWSAAYAALGGAVASVFGVCAPLLVVPFVRRARRVRRPG